jgi:O-antigen ligase
MPPRITLGLEIGLVLLLAFTTLSFGGTPYWSRTTLELGAAGLLLTWWFAAARHRPPIAFEAGGSAAGLEWGGVRWRRTWLGVPAALFVGILLLQLVPLPGGIRTLVSPGLGELLRPLADVLPEATHAASTSIGWGTLSLDPGATLDSLLLAVAYAALFVFVVNFVDSRERLLQVVQGLVALGGVIALIGLVQDLAGAERIYGLKSLRYGGSPYGPFVNHNHFAGMMEMTIPLTLGLLLRRLFRPALPHRRGAAGEPSGPGSAARRLLEGGGEAKGEREGQALLLVLLLVVMLAALFRSLSRGGLMSLVLAGAVVLVLLAIGGRLSRWEVAAMVLVGALAVGAFLLIGPEEALAHFRQAEDLQNEPSLVGRVRVWQATLGIVPHFPLLGVGLGTFPIAFLHHYPAGTENYWLQAHNDYVQLLAEVGGSGALIAAAALLALLVRLLRPLVGGVSVRERYLFYGLATGVLSLLVHSLVDFNLQIPANASLFVVLAALALAQASTLARDARAGGD